MEDLYKSIQIFCPLPREEFERISPLFTPVEVKKGEFYDELGNNSHSFGYIKKGLIRGFYITEDGKEYTKVFRNEGQFTACYPSLLTKEPTNHSLEALEDSLIYTANYHTFIEKTQGSPIWDIFFRKVNEIEYLIKEKREYQFLTMNAQERVDAFFNDYPMLIDRLSQRHLASFLRVDRASLNRILNQKYKS